MCPDHLDRSDSGRSFKWMKRLIKRRWGICGSSASFLMVDMKMVWLHVDYTAFFDGCEPCFKPFLNYSIFRFPSRSWYVYRGNGLKQAVSAVCVSQEFWWHLKTFGIIIMCLFEVEYLAEEWIFRIGDPIIVSFKLASSIEQKKFAEMEVEKCNTKQPCINYVMTKFKYLLPLHESNAILNI